MPGLFPKNPTFISISAVVPATIVAEAVAVWIVLLLKVIPSSWIGWSPAFAPVSSVPSREMSTVKNASFSPLILLPTAVSVLSPPLSSRSILPASSLIRYAPSSSPAAPLAFKTIKSDSTCWSDMCLSKARVNPSPRGIPGDSYGPSWARPSLPSEINLSALSPPCDTVSFSKKS